MTYHGCVYINIIFRGFYMYQGGRECGFTDIKNHLKSNKTTAHLHKLQGT